MTAPPTLTSRPEVGQAVVSLSGRTSLAATVAAVYTAQLSRARVARAPLLIVATLQSIGLLLLLRGIVDQPGDVTARAIVAGSTVLVVAFVTLNLLAQRIGALKATGGLDYYAALPVRPVGVVLGTAASYATFTVPGAVVTAAVGAAIYDLPFAHLWLLAPVLALAGASLAGLGALIGLVMRRPETATLAGQLAMSVVLFLGLIPAERLPLILRGVRAVVPSTYAVDALAGALQPQPQWSAIGIDLLICALVAVASLTAASWAFRRVGRR